MSTVSGVRGFSLAMYGQSGAVMDWTGLTDPFTQIFPLKITNAYSGTLWFQGNLTVPRSGYYTFSGVQMGSVASGASAVVNMTWDVGVSGWIVSSSPITDSLTLVVGAFTSSNYTGLYGSGSFPLTNTLFTRWSGVIKVFGDIYNNDQPSLAAALQTTGTFVSGQKMGYWVSYFLSGWESDVGGGVGSPAMSGTGGFNITWSAVAGVTQYAIWRYSGTTDYTLYQPVGGLVQALQPLDLVAITSGTSFSDINAAPLQSSMYRHRVWQNVAGSLVLSDAATYLTAPSSMKLPVAGAQNTTYEHSFFIKKNISGNSPIGPWWAVFHLRGTAASNYAILLQQGSDASVSGTLVADSTTLGPLANVWYRHAIYISGYSASGWVTLQTPIGGVANNWDDVFICAQS